MVLFIDIDDKKKWISGNISGMNWNLAESALLSHGFRRITEEQIFAVWTKDNPKAAWMEERSIKIGGIC